jgi:hypothetical protein
MNIGESNTRTMMSLKDMKHFQHAMSRNGNWWRERLRSQFGFDVWKLPVCERCEGWALWHKEGDQPVGACQCGHITKNPMTVEQFYTEGHHVDRTVNRDKTMILDRKFVNREGVATVYAGEADLPSDQNRKILIARS